jgi:DNA (cytosine-5)-methyltransferase 1
MKKVKVLNNYSGPGGNRAKWENVEVTAVEKDKDVAQIYQDRFPQDNVIVGDAHQYLLDHYREFDFIWCSPPCPTHSEIRVCGAKTGQYPPMYPDYNLWQEVTFLKHFTKDIMWVVENVKLYYEPIIQPTFKLDRHYFFASFQAPQTKFIKKDTPLINIKSSSHVYGLCLDKYKTAKRKDQILRDQVNPDVGLYIFNAAMGCVSTCKQGKLF